MDQNRLRAGPRTLNQRVIDLGEKEREGGSHLQRELVLGF
jgi:hypothetical protein